MRACGLCLVLICFVSGWGGVLSPSAIASTNALPSLEEALAARQDVWGLAAMRLTNGPNYDFFANLLPPLRYVNADFRHYPIVLSAPNAPQKARLISNGSALNARANLSSWKEIGTPLIFHVGGEIFGRDLKKLDGPHFERGYLPVVKFSYQNAGNIFEEEAFAATEPALAAHGVVILQFGVKGNGSGEVTATFDTSGPLRILQGMVQTTNLEIIAFFDSSWQWVAAKKKLVAQANSRERPVLAVATKPMTTDTAGTLSSTYHSLVSTHAFKAARQDCLTAWEQRLDNGTKLEVPEKLVNDAWRSLIISLFTLANGNILNYSAGNSYERVYEAETADSVGALLLWGHEQEARRMIGPLLEYNRDKLKFHNAGFKLQALAQYYWLSRDTNFISSTQGKWQPEVDRIITGRERESGLFPREQYCGDIFQDVYSLHSAGAAWKGLRDFSAVLGAMGDKADAERLGVDSRHFREAILAATVKSERNDVQPPFIPVALFGEEKPYDPLTGSKMGSYWNLMAPYMLGSGMFGPGSVRERALVDYLQERGGVCMGLIRFDQHSGLFANESAVDDLYGLRYTAKLLELDEVDRALVSFYGKLAQGLTRETFVGAESTGLRPLDASGRPMYLPPNSTAQAYFLWTLRYLLVQDWDLDDNGEPETLRLCFATPRSWLADGKSIELQNAPTAFGPVSLRVESRLRQGEVIATLDLPARDIPRHSLLRIRVPDGWRIVGAKVEGRALQVDLRGTVDISSLKGRAILRFQTKTD